MSVGKSLRYVAAVASAVFMVLAVAACGSPDMRTIISVWSWEPSMKGEALAFEKANPDIRVDVTTRSGYGNLNTAIQDGYGLPDIVQLEYYALPQYAASGQLLDITGKTADYGSFYTPGTWSSVQRNGKVYAVPMDSGPMAFFYNADVFAQVGVDASSIRTWDDYYKAAKKLKQIGVYIAADAGDASFYNAMIWLAGGRPFSSSQGDHTVTVNLDDDGGTMEFTAFWQKMIDEGLVNTQLTTWSDKWKEAVGSGTVASVFSGAWMPSMLLSDVSGSAGLWRVAAMPTPDGDNQNAENGGSSLGILQSSRKPDAAFRFIDYVCHNRAGIDRRVAGGAFPADVQTLNSDDFLSKTTLKDSRGVDVQYFGGQQFNRVLSQAAQSVSVGYQYLPFEVYARSDFGNQVGKAYTWSNKKRAFDSTQQRIEEGQNNADGTPLVLPENPGKRVTLKNAIGLWQDDLKEYGANQGFTMQ